MSYHAALLHACVVHAGCTRHTHSPQLARLQRGVMSRLCGAHELEQFVCPPPLLVLEASRTRRLGSAIEGAIKQQSPFQWSTPIDRVHTPAATARGTSKSHQARPTHHGCYGKTDKKSKMDWGGWVMFCFPGTRRIGRVNGAEGAEGALHTHTHTHNLPPRGFLPW
jgi:hypothetical protein